MSFFNYLSARQYSLDSTNYGAPSNATINTDYLGDIVLNPSASATVIVPSLALNAVEQGATTNPTITTDEYGDIYLNPDSASSVQITSDLTVTGTTITLGNASGNNTIQTAGNLELNSGSGDTVQLNGAVCRLGATSYTDVTGGYLSMQFTGTTTTGNNSFWFGSSTSGSTTGLAQMNMYNNQNTAVGTFLIDSENNLNIYNETATTVPSLQLASSGDISLNASSVTISGTTLTLGNGAGNNTIQTAGNLELNSGTGDTVQLNGAVCRLGATSYTDVTGGYLSMQFTGTTTTGNNSFWFGTYTSGSETGFSQINMYNSSNSAIGTFTIDSTNNVNIFNESATTPPSLQLTSGGDVCLNGPTYIGSTSSSAISNFAFGNITFSDVNTTDSYYEYSPAINLQFVPSGVVIGATTSTPAIYYPITTAWTGLTATSGYAYSFQIYFLLSAGNGGNNSDYMITWMAIA